MASIKKIKRKKGTVYKAEVRRKGHQYISKTFRKLSDARKWAKYTEKMMRLSDYREEGLAISESTSALFEEIKRLKMEIQQLKEIVDINGG